MKLLIVYCTWQAPNMTAPCSLNRCWFIRASLIIFMWSNHTFSMQPVKFFLVCNDFPGCKKLFIPPKWIWKVKYRHYNCCQRQSYWIWLNICLTTRWLCFTTHIWTQPKSWKCSQKVHDCAPPPPIKNELPQYFKSVLVKWFKILS